MLMDSFFSTLFGLNVCLTHLNKRYSSALFLTDIFVLLAVRSCNRSGVKIGICWLIDMFAANGRRCSYTVIDTSLNRLEALGLLVRVGRRGSGRSLIALTCTKLGLQALKDFEELVQNYKVAGVPGSS